MAAWTNRLAGADDPVIKPFSARELLARISARLESVPLHREALRREHELRNAILDTMAETFYALDRDWRYTSFNAHAAAQLRRLGKDPAIFLGKVLWEEFPDPPVEDDLRRVMRERVAITHEVYYAPLGEWVENRIYPSPDGGITVFQRYITERKQAEEERRRREAYLAQAQALSQTASWAWNPRTREVFWSAEHFRIFGLDPAQGQPTYETVVAGIHPDDRPLLERAFASAVAERRSYALECRVVRPDGEIRHIRSIGQPVLDESGDLTEYVGTIIDLTERLRAEEALRRSREQLAHVTRVATMGELAASLAHELSQPLTAIVTNGGASLGFLGRPSPDLDKAMAAIRSMIEHAERAGEIIAGTRAFLKKSASQRTLVDVDSLIREVLVVIQPEIRRQQVLLRASLADDLPRVLGDPIQIQQVAVNLIVNAIEAMASVTDRRRELIVRSARHDVEGMPAVLVEVRDSGIGFAPEDVDRQFEAFYTTKSDGLGMGLSVSRSVIEAHGGRLAARRNETVGATFHFILPGQTEPAP